VDEATALLLINNIAVLSSILAGFSFTVVVQLAMAKDDRPQRTAMRVGFISFLVCTVALVVSVIAGVALIFPDQESRNVELLAAMWLLGMLVGAIGFGCGLISLGWIRSREYGMLATAAGIGFFVLLAVAVWLVASSSSAFTWEIS
jgi:hypothetical protein